jgi:hypothetical protein
MIYFSGHGAQLPRPGGSDDSEADGLEEIILPADFRILDAGGPSQHFENHITDDEIGAYIDRMIAAGATVWLVADSCHSGTLRRSAGEGAVARFVNLGFAGGPEGQGFAPVARARSGGFVGFYGARAGELAYEVPIDEAVHGLLTWSLARALRAGDTARFGDLARAVSGDLWRHGQGRAAPAFDGNLGAAHFFGTTGEEPVMSLQWDAAAERLQVTGGRADGLRPGSRLSVFGEGPQPLFSARITRAGLIRSDLSEPEGTGALDDVLRGEGLDPERFRERWLADRAPALRARVTERALSDGLRVKVPERAALPEAFRADLIAALAGDPALIPEENGDAPVRLRVADGLIRIEPSDPGAAEALAVRAELAALPELLGHLRRVAKSRALLELAGELAGARPTAALQAGLSIRTGVRGPEGACEATDTRRAVDIVAQVRDCDEVTVTLSNRGGEPLDLTPLYLAADHQVYFLTGFDGFQEGGLRLAPGARADLRYTEVTQATGGATLATGMMHLLVLAVVSDGQWPPRDFRHLQDVAPPPLSRSGPQGPLAQLLDSAAFGLRLRSVVTPRDTGEAGAIVIPLRTVGAERRVAAHEQ